MKCIAPIKRDVPRKAKTSVAHVFVYSTHLGLAPYQNELEAHHRPGHWPGDIAHSLFYRQPNILGGVVNQATHPVNDLILRIPPHQLIERAAICGVPMVLPPLALIGRLSFQAVRGCARPAMMKGGEAREEVP